MEQKVKKVTSGFGCRKTYKGQVGFDKYYIDKVVKKVVKKVGDGEDDYVLVTKVIETKKDIAETINAQKEQSGLQAFMKPYLQAGLDLPEVKVTDEIQDFSKMPTTPEEAKNLTDNMFKIFNNIDPRLKGDAKTPEEFISKFTNEKFNNYVNSLKENNKKVEVKENENN